MIMIAVGQTGVGKTHRSCIEIDDYVRIHKRKALIFDVNCEAAYAKYPSIAFDVDKEDDFERANPIVALSHPRGRRVIPFKKNGNPFDNKDKAKTALTCLHYFSHGLLVLEDINTYQTSFASQDFVSILVNNRHRNQDILIHLQSLAKIATTLWQNLTIIRMHRQNDDPKRYRDRIPNYELVKIADNIVKSEFNKGNRHFYVYVNVRTDKISGATQEQFTEAAKTYAIREARMEVQQLLSDIDPKKGTKRYRNFQEALDAWIASKMDYLA